MHERTRTYPIAAWLALLAIAMLFVAPVVSKSIARQAACQHFSAVSSMPMPAMHHDMPMAAHCAESVAMDHQMMSGQAMSPMEEIACGYCQLLVHLPFVQLLLAMLLWLLLLFIVRHPLIPIVCAPIFRAWTPQRARAPPAVFLSSFND
ncbi:DUF2946 family protein [Raoultella sp. 10-1]|uniref:DUF2946 family protein n=1 Tax=Raoultella sp. 10-1 TaxID=2683201 RepID=UPI001CB95C30|nr:MULTISPECIES: DUF2946 family protein [Enterobacteriaceae]